MRHSDAARDVQPCAFHLLRLLYRCRDERQRQCRLFLENSRKRGGEAFFLLAPLGVSEGALLAGVAPVAGGEDRLGRVCAVRARPLPPCHRRECGGKGGGNAGASRLSSTGGKSGEEGDAPFGGRLTDPPDSRRGGVGRRERAETLVSFG